MCNVIIHPSCTNRIAVKYIQARTGRLAVIRDGYIELIEHQRLADKIIQKEMGK